MSMEKLLLLEHVENLRFNQQLELDRAAAQAEAEANALSMYIESKNEIKRLKASFAQEKLKIHEFYISKINLLQSQFQVLAAALEKKTATPDKNQDSSMSIEECEEVVDAYLFLSEFLEDNEDVSDDVIINKKSMREWRLMMDDIQASLPNEKLLDELISKLNK